MTCGIYAISRKDSTDCYIGQSIRIEERLKEHFRELRAGTHKARFLQRTFNKYGAGVFQTVTLAVVSPERLTETEQNWIDELQPSYNSAPVAGSTRGYKFSAEARANVSAAHKRRYQDPAERAKASLGRLGKVSPWKGKTPSAESRAKMAAAKLGKPSPRRGVKLSSATKRKISLARLGQPSPNKGKRSPYKGIPKCQWATRRLELNSMEIT